MDREPQVTRFVSGPWEDAAAHQRFIVERTMGPYPAGQGYWTITPRDNPEAFLGWVLLIPLDAVGPEVEIGWRLRPLAWGRGIATEAARPILDHGLGAAGLARVVADIDPENIASISVAEKVGLRRTSIVEGRFRYLRERD
jgi:RimJ/RimL family protein N-acetyltransferase